MTYELHFQSGDIEFIVIDEETPEVLAALKHIFDLPDKTTEIRIHSADIEFFVEGEKPLPQ